MASLTDLKIQLRMRSMPHLKDKIIGSGALSGKMLLLRIVKNNNFMLTLGQVRLSNC